MTERFVSSNLDLSLLPAPQVVKDVSYETILAERLARLKVLWPDLDTANLESEPVVILQQEDAYREALDLAAINDAARGVMLAYATGGNLDNLAAFYGVVRHVVTPADPDAGTLAVMEGDSDLRKRAQLAPEALPYAGMTGGGYRSLALKTAPALKDATPIKRPGGLVDMVLLARNGDGAVNSGTVDQVYRAFQDDDATQLTDTVAVRSAEIVSYAIVLLLKVRLGAAQDLVRARATAAVAAYAISRHAVGAPVYAQMIEAAASVGGVEESLLQSPGGDLLPTNSQAAYCTGITINFEVVE